MGRERYQRFSRRFLGATVDLDETYEWGREERPHRRRAGSCGTGAIRSGVSPAEAMARLDADPSRQLQGTDALKQWMQETSDAAVVALAGTHFDIAEPLRCLSAASRPRKTAASITPAPPPTSRVQAECGGRHQLGTWREDDGLPRGRAGPSVCRSVGHHRASAEQVARPALLRVSGHGEGWALYAERPDGRPRFPRRSRGPDGHARRATDARGAGCARYQRASRQAVPQWGGGIWDADKAWPFLLANVNMNEGFVRFELDRYLGWPGQAPSYEVGQRLWKTLERRRGAP
ncbi:MAG: DUF885 family protein [Tessaracoccus sp.]